jgi:acetyl-CoA carboxylase carboxyltransferase component
MKMSRVLFAVAFVLGLAYGGAVVAKSVSDLVVEAKESAQ